MYLYDFAMITQLTQSHMIAANVSQSRGTNMQKETCHSDPSTHVSSIMQWAQDAGMWTGIVTTTMVTHATPAASYSHSGSRDWESSVPEGCNASDIAYQLVHSAPGRGFKVTTKRSSPPSPQKPSSSRRWLNVSFSNSLKGNVWTAVPGIHVLCSSC